MPLGDAGGARPFLDFILSALADAGYARSASSSAPSTTEIRHYYAETAPPTRLQRRVRRAGRATRHCGRGGRGRGRSSATTHALVINGDNYYPPGALAALQRCDGPATALFRAEALLSHGQHCPRNGVRAFAIGAVDADGMLTRIVEKPNEHELAEAGVNPLVSMNCWVMPPEIVRGLPHRSPRRRAASSS